MEQADWVLKVAELDGELQRELVKRKALEFFVICYFCWPVVKWGFRMAWKGCVGMSKLIFLYLKWSTMSNLDRKAILEYIK